MEIVTDRFTVKVRELELALYHVLPNPQRGSSNVFTPDTGKTNHSQLRLLSFSTPTVYIDPCIKRAVLESGRKGS